MRKFLLYLTHISQYFATQTGTHPKVTTKRNIERFRSQVPMPHSFLLAIELITTKTSFCILGWQLKSLGFSYDWDRELSTTDPEYYKWTQWIFLQLFKKGLAHQVLNLS
ncbi:hypothetical protein B296_00008859 [Ensete ventricosum]|uniref:leucine--tRNA ligase n=1 Tax=Ensete ventricosum TaxID=4639 RepID=A0A427B3U7_ENSVE|nr:hypothetical protein B296_00008859 [Ensete ventricosum]